MCAIEMALWDADTMQSKAPRIYAQRMKERKEVMGLTWLKMDLGIEIVSDTPGNQTSISGGRISFHTRCWEMEVTDKGIAMLETSVALVQDAVGMEIPLSMQHVGHLGEVDHPVIHGVHLVSGLSGSKEICGNSRDYRESTYPLLHKGFAA